jgi:hypothetical protein
MTHINEGRHHQDGDHPSAHDLIRRLTGRPPEPTASEGRHARVGEPTDTMPRPMTFGPAEYPARHRA